MHLNPTHSCADGRTRYLVHFIALCENICPQFALNFIHNFQYTIPNQLRPLAILYSPSFLSVSSLFLLLLWQERTLCLLPGCALMPVTRWSLFGAYISTRSRDISRWRGDFDGGSQRQRCGSVEVPSDLGRFQWSVTIQTLSLWRRCRRSSYLLSLYFCSRNTLYLIKCL